MRVVFMGTPQIAADCLSRLIADGFDLVGVYTKPDMPKNRGMKLAMSEVKEVGRGAAGLSARTFRDDAAVEAFAPCARTSLPSWPMVALPQRAGHPGSAASTSTRDILPLRGSAPAQWAF